MKRNTVVALQLLYERVAFVSDPKGGRKATQSSERGQYTKNNRICVFVCVCVCVFVSVCNLLH